MRCGHSRGRRLGFRPALLPSICTPAAKPRRRKSCCFQSKQPAHICWEFAPNKKWAVSPLISPPAGLPTANKADKLVRILRIRLILKNFNVRGNSNKDAKSNDAAYSLAPTSPGRSPQVVCDAPNRALIEMAKPRSMNIYTIMRAIQQRVRIALGATVIGTIAGALGGYLLGRATTLSQTEARLVQYSNRMLNEGDAGTAESRKVLAEMNASPYAFCSDDEVAYFRGLVFRAEYLKDAGRMRDGQIECSATLSHVPATQKRLRPDFIQTDGTLLYQDLPMFRIGNRSAITVQSGDSYIVYNPYNPTPPISAPLHYILTDSDVATRTTGRLMGEMPQVPQTILRTEGLTRYSGSIYATKCTSDRAVCVTTYVAIPEAILTNRTALSIFVLMGALAGGSFGIYLLSHLRTQSGNGSSPSAGDPTRRTQSGLSAHRRSGDRRNCRSRSTGPLD